MYSEKERFEYILHNKNTIIQTKTNIEYFLNNDEIDEYSKGFLINIMNNSELTHCFENNEYIEKYSSEFVKFTIKGRLSGDIGDDFSQYCKI
jgi:NurA-like 5'-3' nuclease